MQAKAVLLTLSLILALSAAQHHYGHNHEEYETGHVGYQFEYGVHDPHSHDFHSQKEHRDGKNVVGEYVLNDPDGIQRIVKYVAGPHKGFEAIVERKGHAQHPAVYGKHKGGKDEVGGTSYVEIIHWGNQGPEEHHHGH